MKEAVVSFGKVDLNLNIRKIYLNVENQFVWILGFEKSEDFEWSVKICCDSVIHKNKLSLRWGYF